MDERRIVDETRGLWRGKSLENNEWLVGYLLRAKGVMSITVSYIMPVEQNEYSDDYIAAQNEWLPISAKTLGECTGLTDKNGKLIFEGDILGFDGAFGSYDLVEYHNGVFGVRSKPEDGGENYSCCEFPLYEELNDCVPAEIIGNIHDNPELLKGDNE